MVIFVIKKKNIDRIDEENVQNCLKYLEKNNHLYKLYLPNYTIEKFYWHKDKPRSTMPFLDTNFVHFKKKNLDKDEENLIIPRRNWFNKSW